MFKKRTVKKTHAEECIDILLNDVECCYDSERMDRIKEAKELAELNKILKSTEEHKSKVDINVIIKTVGTIVGVILLGNYERAKIIPQKASSLFMKSVD